MDHVETVSHQKKFYECKGNSCGLFLGHFCKNEIRLLVVAVVTRINKKLENMNIFNNKKVSLVLQQPIFTLTRKTST